MEEIRKAIKKLRKGKATEEDGIKNEVWYGEERI